MRRHPLAAIVLGAAFGLALAGEVTAATRLQYLVEGECTADFTRMSFDGLLARVDQQPDGNAGSAMTTLFDDDEQLMHLLMHDSHTVMTMESDEDAIDFQSDVGRSVTIHGRRQTEALTGVSQDELLAQAQAMQQSMCPELAGMGYADPDYAEAATRCAETMQQRLQRDPKARGAFVGAFPGKGRRGARREPPAAGMPASAAPAVVRTTHEEAGATRTIAGIECRQHTMRRGDTVLREECRAPIDALGLEAAAKRRLSRMARIGQGMTAGIMSLHPELDEGERGDQVVLQRTCFRNGQRIGSATLQIERDIAIAAGEFRIPAGYAPFSLDTGGVQLPPR